MGILNHKALTCAFGVLLCSTAAQAQDYNLTIQDLLPKQSYDFNLPSGEVLGNPKGMDEYRKMAEEIAKSATSSVMKDLRERGVEMGLLPDGQSPADALAAAPGVAKLPDGFRVSILISRSMGEGAIRDLMNLHRFRKDVRFAFRGVPDGMSVPEFALWLRDVLDPEGQGIDDLNINLDPELFDLAGAELAPTMILEDLHAPAAPGSEGKDVGHIVAKAVGFNDPDWLYERFESGRTDERSTNAVVIEEEDLRTRATREAEAVASRLTRDPEVLKQRYWDRLGRDLRSMRVTPAAVDRRRVLHFMFRTAEAITDKDGKVIAYSGEVFQPKDVHVWDRRIFIFNPNIPKEVEFVSEALKEPRPGVVKVSLIATEVPKTAPGQAPWDGIQALIDRFGVQTFLLNENFRSSFQIENTPTELFPEEIAGSVEVISNEYALQ